MNIFKTLNMYAFYRLVTTRKVIKQTAIEKKILSVKLFNSTPTSNDMTSIREFGGKSLSLCLCLCDVSILSDTTRVLPYGFVYAETAPRH